MFIFIYIILVMYYHPFMILDRRGPWRICKKNDLQLFAKEENINVNFFKITSNDIIENFERVG